jgi:hypothetical protein
MMPFGKEHELHTRRRKSNMWLGLVLGGFVTLVFAITVVKMTNGVTMADFNHEARPAQAQQVQG